MAVMKSKRILVASLVAILLLGGAIAAAFVSSNEGASDPAQQFAGGGKVRRLSGDRLKLRDGRDVEFAGVRLPYDHEPYAEDSRRVLAKWVDDEGIRLQFDELREHRKDRIFAYVYANDTFINERLAREGLAFVKLRAGNRQHAELLLESQESARAERKGIWSILTPTTQGEIRGDEAGATFHRPQCDKLPQGVTFKDFQGTAAAFSKGMAPCGNCRPLDDSVN